MEKHSKRSLIKHAIKQVGIVLLVHLVAMIVYLLTWSSSITRMMLDEEIVRAHSSVFWFGVIICALFALIYTKADISYVEYRKELKESLREGASVWQIFCQKHLAKDLIKVGVFALLEIPFLIVSLIVPYSLLMPIFLENFYVMDAGAVLMTGSAWLGILLNIVRFGVVFFAFRLLAVSLACRDVKKEMI